MDFAAMIAEWVPFHELGLSGFVWVISSFLIYAYAIYLLMEKLGIFRRTLVLNALISCAFAFLGVRVYFTVPFTLFLFPILGGLFMIAYSKFQGNISRILFIIIVIILLLILPSILAGLMNYAMSFI